MSQVPKTVMFSGCRTRIASETSAAVRCRRSALERCRIRSPPCLAQVQNDLFDVGADLCNPIVPDPAYPPLRITPDCVTRLEGWCDEFNADLLASWTSFILPGGTPAGALLHAPRTVARRAERRRRALYGWRSERTNREAIRYLNRLSDLLFIFGARGLTPDGDVKWRPGGDR